jgi:hypothetical protein
MKQSAKAVSAGSPAKQVAGFIAKFDSRMAKLIAEVRAALRKRFPPRANGSMTITTSS